MFLPQAWDAPRGEKFTATGELEVRFSQGFGNQDGQEIEWRLGNKDIIVELGKNATETQVNLRIELNLGLEGTATVRVDSLDKSIVVDRNNQGWPEERSFPVSLSCRVRQ